MPESTQETRRSCPPGLSVVVPTHDSRDITLACLESLVDAHRPDARNHGSVEILVVDDGSSDGTSEAIRRNYPQVRLLRHQRARGFSAAANRGLDAARGELLWLLNSDTEVAPDSVAELLRVFREHPSVGVVGAQLSYPDGSPQWSGGPAPTLPWLAALASGLPPLLGRLPGWRRAKPLAGQEPRRVDWVTGASLALRRPVWEACGPLDEGYRFYAQDLDFCLAVRRDGWEVVMEPSVRVIHHHGATIARDPGSHSGRQQPALLWRDLVRWARKHRGPGWACRARRALLLGGWVRVLTRRCLSPFVLPLLGRSRHRPWRRDTAAFRRALRDLTSD